MLSAGLDAGKALWPQLSALLRRAKSGAPGDAAGEPRERRVPVLEEETILNFDDGCGPEDLVQLPYKWLHHGLWMFMVHIIYLQL